MKPLVLIVDDSQMMLRFVAGLLAAPAKDTVAPSVLTASRAREGLLRAAQSRPDLVLLDFALPDMAADDFCQKLATGAAAAQAPLPVIVAMCAANADPRLLELARQRADATLLKPFTPEALAAALRPWLEPDAVRARRAGPAAGSSDAHDAEEKSRVRARLTVPTPPAERGGHEADGERPSSTQARDTRVPRRLAIAAEPSAPATAPALPRAVFRGATPKFSLRAALRVAVEDKLTGVLRLFPARRAGAQPAEVFVRDGAIALVTTREAGAYAEGAMFPSPVDPAALAAAVDAQAESGCPFPTLLKERGLLSDFDAAALGQELGQRLFARLWTLPRLPFEFEAQPELPAFVPATGPAEAMAVDDWLLDTLRRLRHDELPGLDDERFDGVPAYTREGYELIPRLRLTEAETEFAAHVNGRADLGAIARGLGLAPVSAFLILFRFRSIELMDYWPAALLSRPAAAPALREENEEAKAAAPRDAAVAKPGAPAPRPETPPEAASRLSAATLARQIAARSAATTWPRVRLAAGDPGVTRIVTPRLRPAQPKPLPPPPRPGENGGRLAG